MNLLSNRLTENFLPGPYTEPRLQLGDVFLGQLHVDGGESVWCQELAVWRRTAKKPAFIQ